MGREIKRVALDFDWPHGMPWKGFINPYRSQKCETCDGSGLNPATKQIQDDWYDFSETGRRWCNNITQDEVDALLEAGRLQDFTHHFIPGKGWTPIDPRPVVTAPQVNAWSRSHMGHDSYNEWICVKTRANRLGVFGHCVTCGGDGEVWFNDRIKQLNESWHENERYEPPSGEGWQLWETVSEGSPVSPVFASAEALTEWLVQDGATRKAAEKFVKSGWVPSMTIVNGVARVGIESAVLFGKNA